MRYQKHGCPCGKIVQKTRYYHYDERKSGYSNYFCERHIKAMMDDYRGQIAKMINVGIQLIRR